MSKNTINYLLLVLGIIILIWGAFTFGISNNKSLINQPAIIAMILGVFIISKQLTKTKELPSKKYKEKLRNKD